MPGKLRLDSNLILLSLLSLIAIAPLFRDGFLQTASGAFPLYNLLALQKESGFFWTPPVGEGSALPYFLAALLRPFLGGNVAALKVLFGLSLLFSVLGMYLFVSRLFEDSGVRSHQEGQEATTGTNQLFAALQSAKAAGLVAAVAYIYAPFYLATVYVSGNPSLVVFLTLLPWTALAFLKLETSLAEQDSGVRLSRMMIGVGLVAALVFAGLVWANPGLGFVSGLVFVVLSLGPVRLFSKGVLPKLAAFVPGSLLGVILALPAIRSAGLTAGVTASGFIDPARLLSSGWGVGATPLEGLPVQPGVVLLGLAFLAVGGAFGSGSASQTWIAVMPSASRQRLQGQLIVFILLLVFLTLPVSSFVWGVLGNVIVRPFEILTLVVFLLAVLGSFVLAQVRSALGLTTIALVVASIVASYGYLTPQYVEIGDGRRLVNGQVDEIVLLDYEVKRGEQSGDGQTIRQGDKVEVTLVWQAKSVPKADLTVFMHLIDQNGKLQAQKDNKPAGGARPFITWASGEVVADKYAIETGKDLPAGVYTIQIGLYDARTGERWPLNLKGQDEHKLILDRVTIN